MPRDNQTHPSVGFVATVCARPSLTLAIPFSRAKGQHPSKAARGARAQEPEDIVAFPRDVPSQLVARMETMDFMA